VGLSELSDFAREVIKKAEDFERESRYAEAGEQYSLLSKEILNGLHLAASTGRFVLTTINEDEGLRSLAEHIEKKAQDSKMHAH